LHIEQAVLAEPCPKCGYHFPVMAETRDSTAVFKDVPELATALVKVDSCADCLVSGMLIKPRRSDFESVGCSEALCRAAEPSA
jgi:ssDNA-binding Zn-finger/Zn-ribbon topoisomerase 1